jgi:hypothetical protein
MAGGMAAGTARRNSGIFAFPAPTAGGNFLTPGPASLAPIIDRPDHCLSGLSLARIIPRPDL